MGEYKSYRYILKNVGKGIVDHTTNNNFHAFFSMLLFNIKLYPNVPDPVSDMNG